ADGEVVIAGGRNVENTYFGFGRQLLRRDYLDIDLLVRGRAAAEARGYFLRLWESGEVRPVERHATDNELRIAARLLDQHDDWLEERIAAAHAASARPSTELHEVGPVDFLHDPPGDK